MNTDHHAELYGKFRAAVLSRHFAIRPYFRTNLGTRDNATDSGNWLEMGPNEDAAWLAGQEEDVQQLRRWRRADAMIGPGNPLLWGGRLLTCLAVEHLMGRSDALRIIKLFVETLGSLYKFEGKPELEGKHFDGYIVRYDAVTNGGWYFRGGSNTPNLSLAFPITQDGQYQYSTPLNDPRYMRPLPNNYKPEGRWLFTFHCRAPEISQDELYGLILGYFIVFHLLKTDNSAEAQAVRQEIARQAGNLADYLAEYGYLLARPAGGLQGHAVFGEFPALRVFKRITGWPIEELQSRGSFEDALKKADVWKCVEIPFNLWGSDSPKLASLAPRVLSSLV